jgi:hypothetical protein
MPTSNGSPESSRQLVIQFTIGDGPLQSPSGIPPSRVTVTGMALEKRAAAC